MTDRKRAYVIGVRLTALASDALRRTAELSAERSEYTDDWRKECSDFIENTEDWMLGYSSKLIARVSDKDTGYAMLEILRLARDNDKGDYPGIVKTCFLGYNAVLVTYDKQMAEAVLKGDNEGKNCLYYTLFHAAAGERYCCDVLLNNWR